MCIFLANKHSAALLFCDSREPLPLGFAFSYTKHEGQAAWSQFSLHIMIILAPMNIVPKTKWHALLIQHSHPEHFFSRVLRICRKEQHTKRTVVFEDQNVSLGIRCLALGTAVRAEGVFAGLRCMLLFAIRSQALHGAEQH